MNSTHLVETGSSEGAFQASHLDCRYCRFVVRAPSGASIQTESTRRRAEATVERCGRWYGPGYYFDRIVGHWCQYPERAAVSL